MCRLLAVQASEPIWISAWLDAFRDACAASREYQGHGWGVAWRDGDLWCRHRSLTPIWEDDFVVPPTRLAIVHARSAFENRDIEVENNMPFLGQRFAFAFNGELRGVRLKGRGATGAARLHDLVERFAHTTKDDPATILRRLDDLVHDRSDYVRALNLVVSDGSELVAHCRYGEDPDYFTLHGALLPDGCAVVCSEPLQTDHLHPDWIPFRNGETWRIEGGTPCYS